MNNQTFIIAGLVLCNVSAWYVLLTKYLELKQMTKNLNNGNALHIPGMGPLPLDDIPFTMPNDLLEQLQSRASQANTESSTAHAHVPSLQTTYTNRRIICNLACVFHISGFAIITGIPFLNILAPTILWLWKKESHAFLAKQGREVINFQITFTIIQFLALGLGSLCIYFMPNFTAKLFSATKIVSIVFSSSMYLPFNVFTIVPFFWCCIAMLRGAIAAYNGIHYKYPAAQEFIFASKAPSQITVPPAVTSPAAATPPPEKNVKKSMTRKVTFG